MNLPICLAILVLASGCAFMKKKTADLDSTYVGRDKKLSLLAAPQPEFLEEATYTSVFLIRCPNCKESQFLMPKLIQTTGSTTTSKGTTQNRVLHFECKTRGCHERIMLTDEVFIPPVKAIRVR